MYRTLVYFQAVLMHNLIYYIQASFFRRAHNKYKPLFSFKGKLHTLWLQVQIKRRSEWMNQESHQSINNNYSTTVENFQAVLIHYPNIYTSQRFSSRTKQYKPLFSLKWNTLLYGIQFSIQYSWLESHIMTTRKFKTTKRMKKSRINQSISIIWPQVIH